MSHALRLFAAPFLCLCLRAADPAKAPLALRSPVQDKNFYLLSMIERTPAVRAATRSDPGAKHSVRRRLPCLQTVTKSSRAKAGNGGRVGT